MAPLCQRGGMVNAAGAGTQQTAAACSLSRGNTANRSGIFLHVLHSCLLLALLACILHSFWAGGLGTVPLLPYLPTGAWRAMLLLWKLPRPDLRARRREGRLNCWQAACSALFERCLWRCSHLNSVARMARGQPLGCCGAPSLFSSRFARGSLPSQTPCGTAFFTGTYVLNALPLGYRSAAGVLLAPCRTGAFYLSAATASAFVPFPQRARRR
jgi:hypothetical protein